MWLKVLAALPGDPGRSQYSVHKSLGLILNIEKKDSNFVFIYKYA